MGFTTTDQEVGSSNSVGHNKMCYPKIHCIQLFHFMYQDNQQSNSITCDTSFSTLFI